MLRDIFPPEYIIVNLKAADRDEAFAELVDHLCNAGKINGRKEILGAIAEREAKMSTGIEKGIAVPHGKTDAVNTVCGAVGISRGGIDYDTLDGEPVYILFMVVAPPQDTEQHLKVLRHLAELLENPQFHSELQSQKDSQGVYNIICKYEEGVLSASSTRG